MRFLDANKGSIVHWEESVRFAVWALAVDKVKASLTMLGVVIGSAALVLVVTIASTGKAYMISQIEGIGSNLAYASLDRTGTTTVPEDELTLGDLSAARQTLLGVQAVAGTYDLPVDVQLRAKRSILDWSELLRISKVSATCELSPVDISTQTILFPASKFA